MQHILVVGFGNPYRGDDGFGLHAAEQFEEMNHDPEVRVVATQELHPELAEVISQADLVLFLDAGTEGVPGTIQVGELFPSERTTGLFSHELTPVSLLAAAKIVYGHCPAGMLITVTGENFGISSHLSPEVAAALPRVYIRIQEIIAAAKGHEPVLARAARVGQ